MRARVFVALLAWFSVWISPGRALAACYLIPDTVKSYEGAVGSANRPYASPGETVDLRVRPCDRDSIGLGRTADDHVVTILSRPAGRAPHATILTVQACSLAAVTACEDELRTVDSAATVSCVEGASAGIEVVGEGPDRRLRFRFPDTAAQAGPASGGLAGPASIAVSSADGPLPCGQVASGCDAATGLRFCIDQFFENDGACGRDRSDPVFPGFTALPPANDFQAACSSEQPPCLPSGGDIRLTADAAGNLLFPFNWQGILVRDGGIPVPRLLRARFTGAFDLRIPDAVFLGSFTPEGAKLPPIFEPLAPPAARPNDLSILGSADAPYTILRVARRHGACVGGNSAGSFCASDLDCPGSGVCGATCARSFVPCQGDEDCGPGVRCGQLFDPAILRGEDGVLFIAPTGGGTISGCGSGGDCVAYEFEAELPVPLEGLAETNEVRAFAVREAIDGVDRNGDTDAIDTVLVVRDRSSGEPRPIPIVDGCAIDSSAEGRSMARMSVPPFSFPALAVEGQHVAFLESELSSNHCDLNGDGDRSDLIPRSFGLVDGEIGTGTCSDGSLCREDSDCIGRCLLRAVSPALVIDGQSLGLSRGRFFFRSSEAAMVRRGTDILSVTQRGSPGDGFSGRPRISRDGTTLVYASGATNLIGARGDGNQSGDVYVRELCAECSQASQRVSVSNSGAEGNDDAFGQPDISDNGRFVVFGSHADNLLADSPTGPGAFDRNEVGDIFVRDRCTGSAPAGCAPSTTVMSVASDGSAANGASHGYAMSGDAFLVAFVSEATNLVDESLAAGPHVFVRERCVIGRQERAECILRLGGPAGTRVIGAEVGADETAPVSMSRSGRFVTFVAADGRGMLYDLDLDELQTVTLSVTGDDRTGTPHAVSADGRLVLFVSDASDLIEQGTDTNGVSDVFVRDRCRVDGLPIRGCEPGNQRVSVALLGGEGDAESVAPAMSDDGRWVVFASLASNLVGPDGDRNQLFDTFLADLMSGVVERVSERDDGGESAGSFSPGGSDVSSDGQVVVFASGANDLTDGRDSNGAIDVFGSTAEGAGEVDSALFADGEPNDTVLEVVDLGTRTLTTLCPSGAVSVGPRLTAFLRPESVVGTDECPGGPLNGDGDVEDEVVHVWSSGVAVSLERSAVAIAASRDSAFDYLAALVSESGDGVDYNQDGDLDDRVVQTWHEDPPQWSNSEAVADSVFTSGTWVAFTTREADHGADLSGDGLLSARVLRVSDRLSVPSAVVNTRQTVEDLVIGVDAPSACGAQLIAIRTSERLQGRNLNRQSEGSLTGDADLDDDVLQVYDLRTQEIRNSGQAIIPCRIPQCDPRFPYRVTGSKVSFLTRELDQGSSDLSGDGQVGGIVLQVYDACTGAVTTIGPVSEDGDSDPLLDAVRGRTFVAPAGQCNTEERCDPAVSGGCGAGASCLDDRCNAATGACLAQPGLACGRDADCRRCVLRQPATCVRQSDCPRDTLCVATAVSVGTGVADTDQDGVPDDQDNCAEEVNPSQGNADRDMVGDQCDGQTTPRGVLGRSLSLRQRAGDATSRRLAVALRDGFLGAALTATGEAPSREGMEIDVSNPATGERATLRLPASRWLARVRDEEVRRYEYRDPRGIDGPCTRALYAPGRILKVSCRGEEIEFTLDERVQEQLEIEVRIGSVRQCALFGGTVTRDRPVAADRSGAFRARSAPRPDGCTGEAVAGSAS